MRRKGGDALILTALWLIIFAVNGQMLVVSPILPHIEAALNISKPLQGNLFTVYAVMMGIFALLTGPASDKYGRRRILLCGGGAMAAALLMHGLANDYLSLLGSRALAGLAAGILSGASVSYIGDYFPMQRRGWANGWIMTGIAAGQIIGIPLGTILAEWGGFQLPFIVFGIIMSGACLLAVVVLPQPNVTRLQGRLTLRTTFINYRNLLRYTSIQAIVGCFVLINISIAFYVIFLPTWLTDTFGMNGYDIAAIAFISGIASVWVAPVVGKRSDCHGRKDLIVNACIGMAVAVAMTTFFVIDFWTAIIIILFVMGMAAARMSPFQALISDIIPPERRGATLSLANAIGQIGMGVGSVLAGFAYMHIGFVYNTALAAIAILLMAVLVWRAIPHTEEKTLQDSPILKETSDTLLEKISDQDTLYWKKPQL